MKREKFGILSIILDKTIFGFLIVLISLTLNFVFSQNSFAEYKAKLSASISESTASIDGTEIIESSDETAEHEINLKVKTTNKTGYTAMISSKTEETALLNTNPAVNTKINSISSTYSLANFPANTWGYRFDDDIDFSPIPAQSAPVNLIKTTEKSTEEENHYIKLGMKLNSSLKPGSYENKLIVSVVSNPYTPKAVMTEGWSFNKKLKALETSTNKIERFKKSATAPTASMNAVNIEDEDSDYEIKLWLDPTDKTAYYCAEPEKVYLNMNSSEMFYSKYGEQEIKNILEIDLSSFDTSKVTNMGRMFSGMSNLIALDLSNFDTSKLMDMGRMFSGMSNLTALDLSNFDTSYVTDMRSMFSSMSSLATLNPSNFDTSKVTNMNGMFYGMRSLTTLDLSNFDTSKVWDMEDMFGDMSSLTTLDLSNFDTSKVMSMNHMFFLNDKDKNKDKLEKIYVNNDFDTTNLRSPAVMFKNRNKLRGGNGSYLADPSTADKSWLRVDRPGVQGYFTRKP